MEISEVDLLFLEPPVVGAVTQVNQLKVDSVTEQTDPPMVTEFPSQPWTEPGKPVPVTLTVVPPPRLPSSGELPVIWRETVCWRDPPSGCLAAPLLFTITWRGKVPAGPGASWQVISVVSADLRRQGVSPTFTS